MKLGVGAEEQFAGKNRSALQEIIAKRYIIDHQQSQRMCFALTSCDLAGCYDRIIHTAAALAMLNVGISHNRFKTMLNAIQKMIHRIRTVYGDSKISYGGEDMGSWEIFPQGLLQGNASKRISWLYVSGCKY